MNITLIYLDSMRGKSHTPLGLAYLAAHLDAAGHAVEIIACETFHFDRGHILKRIYESSSSIFGISAMFHEIDSASEMVRYIKNIKKNSKVILGGILPTTVPEFALIKTGADIAVKGEAEITIVELVSALENDSKCINKIPGIVIRNVDNSFFDTGNERIIEDINEIKWPKLDIFPYEKLMSQHFYPQDTDNVVADMLTSRGCPFKCNFCYNVSKPRYREVGSVVSEIKFMVKKYGINAINFMDETFVISRKRTEEMCNAILEADIKIIFSTTARANILSLDLCKLLYKAGCRTVNIGLESGDQSMLDRIHKGTTVDQTKRAIEMARNAGIYVEYPCMVGNIGETAESMKRTFDLLKELAWGDYQWRVPFFCTPYPGTEIYKYAIDNGIIADVEDFYVKYKNMNQLSINLASMETNEFLRLYNENVLDLKNHYLKNLSKWKPVGRP